MREINSDFSARRQQRETTRAQRHHDRRVRTLALRTFAALAEADDTISGATMILPDGTSEYLDADLMRQGGRA